MRAISRANGGRPIRDVLKEAINTTGTVKGAALRLGINEQTAQAWAEAFEIEIKTVAV
jgi:hypothetical protein